MPYEIKIDNFEGPLDLLLHLIRKNEMDIYDIQIASITEQYLAVIDAMTSLNLDVAGEFLLMAATLTHIKSRMLLPVVTEEDAGEEEEDPRAELVRRLLEYQKYKEAAVALDTFALLGRDVFARKFPAPDIVGLDEEEFETVGVYELVEAFRELVSQAPEEPYHQVEREQLSVADRVNEIRGRLVAGRSLAFRELFVEAPRRQEVVVTFLAMLELVKLRMVRLVQNRRQGTIWLYAAAEEMDESLPVDEENLGYC